MIADRDGRAIRRSILAFALLLLLAGNSPAYWRRCSYASASSGGASPTATQTATSGGTATLHLRNATQLF